MRIEAFFEDGAAGFKLLRSRCGSRSRAQRTAEELRVLLIEDSPEDAELIFDELRNGELEVELLQVESAEDLRAALTSQPWDIVLCDYVLPAFDALIAAAIVRELRVDLPFIVVSGVIGEESAVAAMKAGARDFVLKDRLARLRPAVERELREAATRRENIAIQERLLLSDRLVQIGTLAASVAHEINNPLTYVIGNLVYALRALRVAVTDSTAVVEALEQALHGAERIRDTTSDLRVFSRRDDRTPQAVDLRRVLDSSIGIAWTQIRHRARLVKDFQSVPLISGSENRLGQVFLNLLINAAQAIPEGDTSEQEICVSLRASPSHVEVTVSDTGTGIPPQVQARLFEPFFTTKPQDIGTGLGLSISRKIVQDYAGEISVRANPPRGTTVCVRLPIKPLDTRNAAALAERPTGARRGRVLMIDDEPELVKSLTRVLELEHAVIGLTDARAALSLLADDRDFDVIICDLMMPGLSGQDFYAQLQELAPGLAARVAFITGGAFTPSGQQFLATVTNPRLDKPFQPERLSALVQQMILHHDTVGGAARRVSIG